MAHPTAHGYAIPARQAVRVPRRRRAVITLSAALLLVGLVLGRLSDHASLPSAGAGPVPIATTTYVVQPGDTLWSIARGVQPEGDVRPLVDRLAKQVDGGQLRAGQPLVVPVVVPPGG